MLDIKYIREHAQTVREALSYKHCSFDLDGLLALDERRRRIIVETDELRARQKKISAQVNVLLKQKQDASADIAASKEISAEIVRLEDEFRVVKNEFDRSMLFIPNIAHESVPRGEAASNVIVRSWGNPRTFDFKPLTHIDIAAQHGLVDFERAAKITGSNFLLFKGMGARLERALINFMLDVHTAKHGYTEIFPPFLVNRASMTTTGQLPKFAEDMYTLPADDVYLIPTAEVPVTNIFRDEILDEAQLPVCYAAYSACFRREAGSYGKDTRGMLRVHQFDKIELVKFVKPDESYQEHEKLTKDACTVLEMLEIPYRIVALATGDLSFAAAKCYDIEIYAPGVDAWLEVSSCSNFEDFQARRGNIRYREKQTGKLRFIHTLNGSGVALARLVIAILENYQNAHGGVSIPEALRRYFDGRESIGDTR